MTQNIVPESDFSEFRDKTKRVKYPTDKGVWARVVDCRYGVEVTRLAPYSGLFRIFDLLDNNKLIHSESAAIAYDAKFGIDQADDFLWRERAVEIIDNL